MPLLGKALTAKLTGDNEAQQIDVRWSALLSNVLPLFIC
jgi:hypothetical protein